MSERNRDRLRVWIVIGVLFLGLWLAGCGSDTPSPSAEPATTDTEASSDASPEQAASDEQTASEGPDAIDLPAANTAFAFELYQMLRIDEGNLFFSPYSVSAALAMALVGARGDTADQMAEVLRFGEQAAAVPGAFGRLDETLASRAETSDSYEGVGFALHVVNALWPQEGYAFEDSFIATLSTAFGAELNALDYAADPEVARITINDWVSDQTKERILDLIPPGLISELTRLVLTNAIYFDAPWLEPFLPEDTALIPFTRLDGTPVGVDMMHRGGTLQYAPWEGGQAFELPYNGNELTMVVLLPDEGSFEAFDSSLTAALFDGIVTSFSTRNVSLGFPKFEYEDDVSLVPYLQSLGLTDPFDGERADFSGITGDRDLVISDVLHKAFVSVDEEGTEAAAATAVLFRATGIPAEPLEVIVDRPFLFVIRDRATGSILFVGRVLDPSA